MCALNTMVPGNSYGDAPVPSPGPEEVLIRSEAVGICVSDVYGFTGGSGRGKAGMVMGHKAAGTVISLGAKVSGLQAGDVVVIFSTLGCGKCRYCQGGQEHICLDKRVLGTEMIIHPQDIAGVTA